MKGYDIDGVLSLGIEPSGEYVVISGRTMAEYDELVKYLAQKAPVYIRCTGEYGDRKDAGKFKAKMINILGVTEFHEDDPIQAEIIKKACPKCQVVMHK